MSHCPRRIRVTSGVFVCVSLSSLGEEVVSGAGPMLPSSFPAGILTLVAGICVVRGWRRMMKRVIKTCTRLVRTCGLNVDVWPLADSWAFFGVGLAAGSRRPPCLQGCRTLWESHPPAVPPAAAPRGVVMVAAGAAPRSGTSGRRARGLSDVKGLGWSGVTVPGCCAVAAASGT